MAIRTEQDIEADIEARPSTYPTIYLDNFWNVVGFNEVARRLFKQSGDPLWFDTPGTLHVFDILCSEHGMAMLSHRHEVSLNSTVLCFRAHVDQDSLRQQEYDAIWERLTRTYPLIEKMRAAKITRGAAKRAYSEGESLTVGGRVYACHITASLDVMNTRHSDLEFVCEIARNEFDPINPTAYRVCLIPDDFVTEAVVMLSQLGQDMPTLTSSLRRVSLPESNDAISLHALLNVVSAGLRDTAAPERYRPTEHFLEEIDNLSETSLDSGLRTSCIEGAIHPSEFWYWEGFGENRRTSLNPVQAIKIEQFICDGHNVIVENMVNSKHNANFVREPSLREYRRDLTPTVEQSKESQRIRDEVRLAMGESALTKYRRDLTPTVEQSKESQRIRDEVRLAMGESALTKYRREPPVKTGKSIT